MTLLFEQGSLRVHHGPGGWTAQCERGAFAVDASGALTVQRGDENAPSFVTATALAARVQRRFHVHAGMVSDDTGATLVCGCSGAGKTTTTMTLADAGAALHGDDVVFLQRARDEGVVASALPRMLHVGAATLAMFPSLRADTRPGVSSLGKSLVDPKTFRTPGAPLVTVRRLVFPCITSASVTTARLLSPSEAMERLLPASAMVVWPTLPHADDHLQALQRLVHTATAVAVALGADTLADPACIAHALEAALSRQDARRSLP